MKEAQNTNTSTDLALLETRLAARLAAVLAEPTERLPAGAAERLRFAREQALAAARRSRTDAGVALGTGGSAVLGRLLPWWPRLGALLPVLVLVAGVLLVDAAARREQAADAAEIDVALLADSLPPAAYADPGFVAFLKLQQP